MPEKGRLMVKKDVETRRLSRQLYREIERRGDPDQDWWVDRDVVERELGMHAEDLFDAAELLVAEGQIAHGSSDLILLRPVHRGPSLL
jgi:hypothetical protein